VQGRAFVGKEPIRVPSTFTWLDASEHDRRRAMEVIDLFQRQTTRDELGIGTVRDALAERLSPGLSTIQTRARYFLIVPWTYLRLERLQCPSADIARRGRNNELRIAEALAQSPDPSGAIGREAGRALLRLPSAIYWGGLGVLGIRLFAGSQDQYHRSLDRFYVAQNRASSLRQDREGEFFGHSNWHPHLPPAPDGFLDELDFQLTQAEAQYLQDRFQARTLGSLIAHLTQRAEPIPETRFPWDEPIGSTYPEPLHSVVEHARCFSELMHGAALLYNLMLSEACERKDWVAGYEERLAQWQALLVDREAAHRAWDRQRFWTLVYESNTRIPIPTRYFASRWIELALGTSPRAVATPTQRKLIRDRELALKRGRARLVHREYLQMYSGAAGAEPIDYRWGVTQDVANDILQGLRGSAGDAVAA